MPTRAKTAFWGAAIGVALMCVTWFAAFHIGFAERADRSILQGFAGLQRPRLDSVATLIDSLCNPSSYVFLVAAVIIIALVRGRPRVAVMCLLVMAGSTATAELLKQLVASPRSFTYPFPLVMPPSWPSGHATAAMSLALCAVIVAPPRRRPLVGAVMAAFAVAVCYSFLELGWHYPSDVLGGFLLAATWTLLGLAALWWLAEARPARRPAPDRSGAELSVPALLAPVGLVVVLGLLLIAAVLAARPDSLGYLSAHAAFTAGAAVIATLGLAIATGMTIALRR